MRPHSLKSKLLIIVSCLVIGSGLLISLLVTPRYSRSLFESMTAQAENLAQAFALDTKQRADSLRAGAARLQQHQADGRYLHSLDAR